VDQQDSVSAPDSTAHKYLMVLFAMLITDIVKEDVMLTRYFSDPVMLDLIQHTPAAPHLLLGANTSATGTPAAMPMAKVNPSAWVTQEQPGVWRATKVVGLNIYNSDNQKIGDVNEVLIDSSGKVTAIVIGAGGFRGMGEHSVAVPFSDLEFVDRAP
jgi:sporulation protein YlmC with PRC-barrel domain